MKTYSPAKTYESGYLNVDKNHEIYYELSGNPKGKPVLFIHGGPGGGTGEKDKRFFNPKKFNIVLFDQRGSGKSKPLASLKNNTTPHLVEDIRKLLSHLKIKKTFLFGGSWGSTLSLCYAIKYPETVAGLVLRGIFLASKKENDYFIYNSRNIYPKAWENMASLVPKDYIKKKKIAEYYYNKITHSDKKIRTKYAKSWAEFEFSISTLLGYNKEGLNNILKSIKFEAFSPIELHYIVNDCFIPEDYILKNTHKIKSIPCSIVHGRYDCVCSPSEAYALHKKLPKSRLIFTIAGHSASDNEEFLVKEMDLMGTIKI